MSHYINNFFPIIHCIYIYIMSSKQTHHTIYNHWDVPEVGKCLGTMGYNPNTPHVWEFVILIHIHPYPNHWSDHFRPGTSNPRVWSPVLPLKLPSDDNPCTVVGMAARSPTLSAAKNRYIRGEGNRGPVRKTMKDDLYVYCIYIYIHYTCVIIYEGHMYICQYICKTCTCNYFKYTM